MEWANHLPPNEEVNATVWEWVQSALKDTSVFKPQILVVYAVPPEEEKMWNDGFSSAMYLLRKTFHLVPINIFGWRPPTQGWNFKLKSVYHFMLGWGPLGGTADTFLRLYHPLDPGPNGPENDGSPTKKGFVISHGGGKTRHISEVYRAIFYPTPWHEAKLRSHRNARHALGVNTNFFAATPPPYFEHKVLCPGISDTKSFCNDGGRADPDTRRRWKKYDFVVVGPIAPGTRLEMLMAKDGDRAVLGVLDPECVECDEIAERLMDADVDIHNIVEAEERADFYRSARVCLFPQRGDGGGEEALLEARAVGCKIEVAEDNPRLQSLVSSQIWGHAYYAEQIQQGIWTALQR